MMSECQQCRGELLWTYHFLYPILVGTGGDPPEKAFAGFMLNLLYDFERRIRGEVERRLGAAGAEALPLPEHVHWEDSRWYVRLGCGYFCLQVDALDDVETDMLRLRAQHRQEQLDAETEDEHQADVRRWVSSRG